MKINKRLLYSALPIVMLIFSCSKNGNLVATPEDNQKLQRVSFNVSGFTSDVTPLSGLITTDVSIRAYNTSGNLIVEKIIKNSVIEKNKMTTLTGALFTSLPSSTATNLTINSEWKPSSIVNF